jgi:hypothetical protein
MSHQSKTLSIPLKGEFWRPTSNWTNYRSEFSRFMVKNADGKSGFINSKVSRVLYSTPLCDYDVRRVAAGMHPFPFPCYQRLWTRLLGSLVFFEAIVNLPWFLRSSVLLFLTEKSDFGAKLHDVRWKYPLIS